MRFTVIIILLFLLATGNGNTANIYEIKNVTATTTAPDASNGRDQAMLQAQSQAFDELQERLLANKYITQKQKISLDRISTAVDSIDVVDEKTSAKTFKGIYNISFSPYQISKIFNIQPIAPTKEPDKFLIIPIVAENNQIKLWKNDWWPLWNDLNHDPIIIPLGDLRDIQNLKVEDLAAHKLSGLTKIAERYGANNIVLVQAQYNETSESLDVQLEKIKGKEKTVISYEYPGDTKIGVKELYKAAAEDIAYRLQNDKLTADNLTTVLNDALPPVTQAKPLHQGSAVASTPPPEPYSPDAPGVGYLGQKHMKNEPPPPPQPQISGPAGNVTNTSEAVVEAPDLLSWQRIRGKISAIPGVTIKIKSLNSGRAYITLTYNTDIDTLKKSLADQGLLAVSSGSNLAIKEK